MPSEPERPGRRRLLAGVAAMAAGGCAGGAEEAPRAPAETGVAFERLGSGPPVVLLHGASGNRRDWTMGPAEVIARRRTVYAFDRPGHGSSGFPAGMESLTTQARMMRAALACEGVQRAVVVGHSYGGSVALAWALDAPDSVEGLVLIASPSHVWPGGLGLSTEILATPVLGPIVAQAASRMVGPAQAQAAARRVFAPQDPPEGYVEALDLDLVLRPETLRANALQLDALKDQIAAMQPRYPTLAMPIETLHGDRDTTVPIEIHSIPLADAAPTARLTSLGGVGHMPHHVATPAVVAALDRLRIRGA